MNDDKQFLRFAIGWEADGQYTEAQARQDLDRWQTEMVVKHGEPLESQDMLRGKAECGTKKYLGRELKFAHDVSCESVSESLDNA